MKKTNQTPDQEQDVTSAEGGARKLQLTVTRMKKLRAAVKGGGGSDHGGGGVTWQAQKINLATRAFEPVRTERGGGCAPFAIEGARSQRPTGGGSPASRGFKIAVGRRRSAPEPGGRERAVPAAGARLARLRRRPAAN